MTTKKVAVFGNFLVETSKQVSKLSIRASIA